MLDYRPDLDPTTPGLLTACIDMVPTLCGYKSAPVPVAQTAHTLTLGASESTISSLFATRWVSTPGGIVIAGTDKHLYVYDFTNGFIKVSKSGGYSLVGSTYQSGEDSTVAFDHCAFGDVLIATHKSVVPQYRSALDRTIATLYADLGTTVTAPKASVCAVASNFVFLGDLHSTWGSGTTVVGTPDMVAWSAIGDHQNWAINPLSTQGSYQQFVDTPGPITALCRLNDGMVVFKASSMYFGRYVGSGTNSPIWDFERISDRVGCIGHRSVIDIGGKLVFVGLEDVHIFDGTQPRSITEGIWETEVKGKTNRDGVYPMWLGHDKINNCVLISRDTGYYLLWSYRYNKWSILRFESQTNSAIQSSDYSTGRYIYCKTNVNDLRVTTSTQTSGTRSTDHYDLYNMFAVGTGANAVPATASKCCVRRTDGTGFLSDQAYVTTGAIGNNEKVSKFSRIMPKFSGRANTATTTTMTAAIDRKDTLGDAWVSCGSAITIDSGKRFDLMSLGNISTPWMRVTLAYAGQTQDELVDIGVTTLPAGSK